MPAAALKYLRQMVKDQAGIVVEPGKDYLTESKLSGIAREQGFAALDQLVDRLRVQPFGELHRRVVEALTTNETSFFRDQRPFEMIRAQIVPQLLAAKPGRKLVIWCAAASSGQEPYSVAMLLREHFPGVARNTRIIASDISREMVARTKAAVYSPFEVHRGLTPQQLAKYTERVDGDWRIKPEIRAMVEPCEINLAAKFPALPPIDILLVRNVLIYFDAATKQDILTRMSGVLAPDGVLLLGGAETTLGVDVELERCTSEHKATWYRRKEPK